jgi:uncharacterized protein
MSAEDNVTTIKTIYEAFGRGDAETILDSEVADDVEWAVDAERSRVGIDSEAARTGSRVSSPTSPVQPTPPVKSRPRS